MTSFKLEFKFFDFFETNPSRILSVHRALTPSQRETVKAAGFQLKNELKFKLTMFQARVSVIWLFRKKSPHEAVSSHKPNTFPRRNCDRGWVSAKTSNEV